MTVMPFVLIVQLVMSGAVFELSGVTELISKFTISRWGLDAIGSIACTTFAVSSGAMFAGAGGWKMSRTICSGAGCCCSPSARRIHFWRCWRSRA